MKIRRIVLWAAAFLCLAGPASPARAGAEPVKVAASSAYAADLVRQVGGDRVSVRALASPKFNAHFYQPTPRDVRDVARADLYVGWGLDLEAWSDPLLEAAGRPEFFRGGARHADLSAGIRLLEVPQGQISRAEGDVHLFGNPHYQMDPRNAPVMARTIARALGSVDPDGASRYAASADAFAAEWGRRLEGWKAACAHCAGQEVVSYHKDMAYLADFLGLKAEQCLEPKPGIPPTPQHLAFLERYIRERGIRAILLPTYYPQDAARRLADRTGARVVTVCQNVGETDDAGDVESFHEHNVRQIARALEP